jgi:regulator of replication initiation timing
MLYRVFMAFLRLIGLTTLSERNALMKEIFKMERLLDETIAENARLEDENKSVWDLIDELQESSKITPATVESFVEDIKETVLDDMLKNFKAAGEA